MSFGKRFVIWLASALFSFSILAVATLASLNSVFGTPDTIKETLAESKIYDSVAEGLVDQATKSTQKPPEARQPDEVPLDEAVVREVATKVITPEKLQGYAEQIVDGTYNWLEGEVDQPDYNLDLSTLKLDLGNTVGDVAVQRVQSLPVCTTAQLRQMDPGSIDPFTLPCQPPGINLQAERQKLVDEITKDDEVLEGNVTADDTKSEETGQTPFEKLGFVPTLFQWSQKGPWIFGVLGLLAAAGIIFLNDDRRKGIKQVSKTLLITGVVLLVGIAVVSFLLNKFQIKDVTAEDPKHFEQAIGDVVRSFNAAFNRVLAVFAGLYAALGAGGLIGLHFTKPKGPASAAREDSAAKEPPKEKTPEPKDADKPDDKHSS